MAKYEAAVDIWGINVQRNSVGQIISSEAEGPIREDRGQYVYDYPAGRTWVLQIDEVLVVWPDGTMQPWNRKTALDLFRPVTAKKPRRRTKAVVEDATPSDDEGDS
jgi:hypothetical protein